MGNCYAGSVANGVLNLKLGNAPIYVIGVGL